MASSSGFLGDKSATEDAEFAEKDPTGRYVRYDDILGKGAFKTVYKAFDEVDGIEVAWNRVNIEDVMQMPGQLERLYSEVHLLKALKHEHIIKLYNSWVDDENKTINMITELFTSGSLRVYRKKHKKVDPKAIKNWARQILKGLHYLHTHSPPIIHRDLKCDNIFVNGNTGEVKLGDLGLAAVMQRSPARSVIGTPEFMAPELYEEEYNELVDIYSFGLCLLEMVTCEYPYSECRNHAQIFKKVTSGIKPQCLDRVDDLQVKQFIEKCLLPVPLRPTALELLKDPFLVIHGLKDSVHPESSSNVTSESVKLPQPEPLPMDIDHSEKNSSICFSLKGSLECPWLPTLEIHRFAENKEFRLRGERNDNVTASMTLRIADPSGHARNVHFAFYLNMDTATAIAEEMVEQLDLSSKEVIVIAEMIDDLIMKLITSVSPSLSCAASTHPESLYASAENSAYPAHKEHTNAQLALLKDRETQESVNSESDVSSDYYLTVNSSGSTNQPSEFSKFSFIECDEGFNPSAVHSDSGTGPCDAYAEKEKIAEAFLNLESLWSSQTSFLDSCSAMSKDANLTSICSLSIADNDQTDGLKQELSAIELQFQHSLQELLRLREDAIENARRKWMTKKQASANNQSDLQLLVPGTQFHQPRSK